MKICKKLINEVVNMFYGNIDEDYQTKIEFLHKKSMDMSLYTRRNRWKQISQFLKLSEDFIREFKDEINWIYVSFYQVLSENFIREFQNKVDWIYISKKQKLSEDFIWEFKDKVDWVYIKRYQQLSEEFKRRIYTGF